MTQNYEVLGIGAPLIDYVISVDEPFLHMIEADKGSMRSVDHPTFERILSKAGSQRTMRMGGSCANTLRGLANLGNACAMAGKVGDDELGNTFIKSMKNSAIASLLTTTATPTGELVCLVTPDGERTFCDFLGASREFTTEDLNPEIFHGVKLVHIEGYTLMNGNVALRAMEYAKQAGALVSFDLANFELVKAYQREIIELISQYVDILFGNSAETRMLTKCEPQQGCDILKDMCEVVVTLMGPDGCWIGHGSDLQRCDAYPVIPLDTTGAGDLFAAGFLHGYLNGHSLNQCAHFGALLGAAVVQVYGADLPEKTWEDLRMKILSQ